MTKQLTPLEALGKLKTIKHIHDMECGVSKSFDEDLMVIETALKALEIIKEKKVYIDWFVSSFIKQDADYNVFLMLLEEMGTDGHLAEQLMMSEEEFDLLKEVLK